MTGVSQHIAALLQLLSEANEKIAENVTGACLYVDPAGGAHCANLTETQCQRVGGQWDPNTCCTYDQPTRLAQCKGQ